MARALLASARPCGRSRLLFAFPRCSASSVMGVVLRARVDWLGGPAAFAELVPLCLLPGVLARALRFGCNVGCTGGAARSVAATLWRFRSSRRARCCCRASCPWPIYAI
jgi:hypothetical protein